MTFSLVRPMDQSAPGARADTAAQPWWRGAVVYQVYPRSFLDTTGDGVGDLNGITRKLSHVADLGVDAIWISPFFTSPMKDYGYDVADYCDVDPVFGSLEDFDRLVGRAHELGIKLIVDQVYSHTSDQHPWFKESRSDRSNPRADWYVWADPKPDGSPPSNWQSVFGGPAWSWDARRQQYYLHNFLAEQPQLNVHNREVQDALLDVARFWLDRGVDGFRLDAINFAMHNRALTDNPPSNVAMSEVTRPFDMQQHIHNQSQPEITDFLERVRGVLDEYGATFSVAEVGGPDPVDEMKAFTKGENRLNSAYNFDFLYADRLTPERVRASVDQWHGTPGEGWPSWAFSNHDSPRALTRWARDGEQDLVARTSMLLLLSLRGNAFIYQGEELGLPQATVPFDRLLDPEAIANWPRTLGRDGARTPMPWTDADSNAGFSSGEPWLPLDPAHSRHAVSRQKNTKGSCLEVTSALLRLRKDVPALRYGSMAVLQASDDILMIERAWRGDVLRCVFNLSSQAAPSPIASGWRVLATEAGLADASSAPDSMLGAWSGFWAIPA